MGIIILPNCAFLVTGFLFLAPVVSFPSMVPPRWPDEKVFEEATYRHQAHDFRPGQKDFQQDTFKKIPLGYSVHGPPSRPGTLISYMTRKLNAAIVQMAPLSPA